MTTTAQIIHLEAIGCLRICRSISLLVLRGDVSGTSQLLTAFSTGSKEELGKESGSEKKATLEIQQTTEKEKCRIKNGEGERKE